MNVGFILDSSSKAEGNFQKETDFMKDLAEYLGVSEKGTRFGVITYGDDATLKMKFSDINKIESFWYAVDKVWKHITPGSI